MSADYDVVLIGGNLEGLVAAATLAKRGLQVGLFETGSKLGGLAKSEEFFPGFHFNSGYQDAGLFADELPDELDLHRHGLEWLRPEALAFAPQTQGGGLTLWQDIERSKSEIAEFSAEDAGAFGDFAEQAGAFSGLLAEMARLAPPSLTYAPPALLLAWARVALKARFLGGRRMMEFLRVLPMSARHYLNEHFENDTLKGLLGALSLSQLMQGPRAAGTSFMLLYQLMGSASGYRRLLVPRGGLGSLSGAMEAAARAQGVDIHTQAGVKSIQVEDYRARGILLESGETVRAKSLLSTADPRSTLLDLLGAPQLEPRIVRRLKNIKFRGSTATTHLALSKLPEFPSSGGDDQRLQASIVICPSLDYAERAYDDAKYGRISENPVLDIGIPSLLDESLAPQGQHAMSVSYRYAPYRLREGSWDEHKERLADLAISTLSSYAPGIERLIQDRKVLSPLDYERDYACPEGSFTHGQMSLDQLLLMRPIFGFAGYRSPMDGLYLGGPSTHPGGGLTGLAGRNAAMQVFKEIWG